MGGSYVEVDGWWFFELAELGVQCFEVCLDQLNHLLQALELVWLVWCVVVWLV